MAGTKPLRRRRLGRALRELRLQAGLSQLAASHALSRYQSGAMITQSQLSRIEAGEVGITADALRTFVAALGADHAASDRLEVLRQHAEKPDEWGEFRPLMSEAMQLAVEAEAEADEIRSYGAVFVPGLLQTAEYAHAVIQSSRAFVRPVDVEALAKLRMQRQRRLVEPAGFRLTAVLTEASLRQLVGGPAILRGQLHRLSGLSQRSHHVIRVLPFTRAPWPGVSEFSLYGFEDGAESPLAHVGSDIGARNYDAPGAVKALRYTFDAALDQSLPGPDSAALINRLLTHMEGAHDADATEPL